MKILLFCAKGFETMEFSVFVDVMGWARNDYHYPVEVETCGFTKTVYSAFHIPIITDRTLDEISADDYGALAIPGGFEEFGVHVVNERIVTDHNVITSYCPETASDVAFELLGKLCGTEQRDIVKSAMGF
ncbi:MAG: DJ-1/PfpI family protein [Lachnospiraceae bacterium]|nr:DJ-1/PfpI family protein [Lachnospiraceae bacterium]